MKQTLLIGFFLLFAIPAVANDPVLLYSDIESGPKNGWSAAEPNKGVSVTIWGHDFGDARGDSYVTVNGVSLDADADYAVWGENWPTPYMQRITFWLNDGMTDGLGEITVTINGVASNPLPFTIRDGSIYFITRSNSGGDGSLDNPFEIKNSSSSWATNMVPGDIFYFRDTEDYVSNNNGGNSIIWLRDSEPNGTTGLPISMLAFPGEKPTFSLPVYDINFSNVLKFDNDYMVVSGLSIDSEYGGATMGGDNHRFIGNDVIGLKNSYQSGTGIINSGKSTAHTGDGNIFLGNAVHGGNSQNRFDHAIYVSGCADDGGVEMGWNYFYDNDFGRGPIISINHQQDRCAGDQVLDAHFVFNNIVDCAKQRAVAINVYDLSYDDGEEEPEPSYVYNNLFMSCGTYDGDDFDNTGYAPAVIHNAKGRVRFYNNTLYNSGYVGISVSDQINNSYIKNNIVHMSTEFPGPTGNHYTSIGNDPGVTLSNNLYFGMGDYDACTGCAVDQNNVLNQSPLFLDEGSLNFGLTESSPAIGAGTSDLVFEIAPPAYAPITRDLNFIVRGSAPSIGTYAYGSNALNIPDIEQPNLNVNTYPNPSSDYIMIGSDETFSTLRIYNLVGQLVRQISTPSGKISIDLPSGVYVMVFVTQDNEQIIKKMLVNKI